MITKSKITITIDKEQDIILDKYCNDKFINKSKLVNNLIKEFLALKYASHKTQK